MPHNTKLTRADLDLITQIAKRTMVLATTYELVYDQMTCVMDLMATHRERPLRLADLLAADDANFAHDVLGIRRHMNRETAEMGGCFLPRFTAPMAVVA